MLTVLADCHASIQDLGRKGFYQYGIPTSGALDFKSHILVNTILGNDINDATIEIIYSSAQFTVNKSGYIALVGADFNFTINGIVMPMRKVIHVNSGDKISLRASHDRMLGYLGVAGGIQSEKVMGSRSIHEQIGIGRRLQVGDVIVSGDGREPSENVRLIEPPEEKTAIRVLAGPQYNLFDEETKRMFVHTPYKVSTQSNRMGYRLKGESLKSTSDSNILSEPTMLGSVQVPPDGQPIVLLNERQTVGGYPKIATVIRADIPKFVQLSFDESFYFTWVTLDAAKREYNELMERLMNKTFIEHVKKAKHIRTSRINKHL